MTPRVLVDTNVFVSYLINPGQSGAVQAIIQAFLEGQYTLLLPDTLFQELLKTVQRKSPLAKRVSLEEIEFFSSALETYGEPIAKIQDPIPALVRDPKDDYLVAYAVVGKADYLVTGDDDLLVFKKIDRVKIITPAEFVSLLKQV
jgi:putative PIN family toxin of toxin-antitoxin system